MRESIIPSDSMLVRTLESVSKTKPARRSPQPILEDQLPVPVAENVKARNQRNDPIRNGATNRIAEMVEH